ncbi:MULTISPECIES: M1 family metallopeptidase [Lactobacillus]|uniref:M1 family peptidase n=1 Tax=Lactobacillus xujianguonis TaxID=2495899 RepID=A0A437SVU3_9LACO|nr:MULTISPECIES: M1 family metallopeptidase [Lactobacillus]RVU71046.1 M1 family peptidase [Lactobacillus xujianguonis]RVU76798.1 M1 family peptidase [Lactobacillus xujianguonis]
MKEKRIWLTLSAVITLGLSFCLTTNLQAASTDPTIKATHYQMQVKLNPKKNQLTEKVTINLQNNSDQTFKQVLVRNIAAGVLKYDQKHFAKHNRQVKTRIKQITTGKQKLTYKLGKDHSDLYVNLNKELDPGQSQKLMVKVTTSVPYRSDRFGYQKVNGGKLYNLSFCFPYLSDYRHGQWVAHPYSDEGENRNSVVSDYQVTFLAPRAYKVAASGQHTTKKGKTIINSPQTRDLAIVASNRFKVSQTKTDGIKIKNFYFLSKNKQNIRNYVKLSNQTAKDSLKLFKKTYGVKYAYPELDITQSPFPEDTGGMEYTGLIMVSDEGFLAKKKAGMQAGYELLQDVSHEVAHQWFFGMIGSDEFNEAWLDEGMAEFSEDYVYDLTETKSSDLFLKLNHVSLPTKKTKANTMKLFTDEVKKAIASKKKTIINYPMDKIPKGQDETNLDYEGAKAFYAELMVAMGKEKFFNAMKDYCQTYYMKQATGKDFLAVIRKYDNSEQVNQIINKFIDPKFLG